MTVRVGYLGSTAAPEFAALQTRKNAVLAALFAPRDDRAAEIAGNAGARLYESAGALLAGPDTDALVLALPPGEQARLLTEAARRKLPTFLVPPIATSHAEGRAALEAAKQTCVVTSVGWPMRYAINLIQIRQRVRRGGVQWVLGRVVAGETTGDDLLNRAASLCDLIRYVAGPVTVHRAAAVPRTCALHARFALASGGVAELSVVAGAKVETAREMSIEVLADGDRMAWYFGTNHTVINGVEQRVAEKVDGLYAAEIAAFLTAAETGRTSPILCDYADAVETLELSDFLRRAWENRG